MRHRPRQLLIGILLISSLSFAIDAESQRGKAVREGLRGVSNALQRLNLPPTVTQPIRAVPRGLSPAVVLDSSGLRGTVYFPSGRSNLDETSRGALRTLAQRAKNYPKATISVSAYADQTGSAFFNAPLSRERAQKIEHYLVSQGISKHRIQTFWAGDTMPLNIYSYGKKAIERRADVILSFESK